MIALRTHQLEAYAAWVTSGRKGTVKAVTASGKTHIALKAIEDLNCAVIVLVPTIALQKQWQKTIKINLGIDCGLIGGGVWDVKKVTVCVVDSLRDKILSTGLFILDECHRYPSRINYEVVKNATYEYILALSATPEREDARHLELFKIAPICYEYNLKRAVKDGVISSFEITPVGVDMENKTAEQYKVLSNEIKARLRDYGYQLPTFQASQGDYRAIKLMRLIAERRALLSNAAEKANFTASLLKQVNKAIVFSESIESIEALAKQIDNYVMYHSEMNNMEKERAIEKFRLDDKCTMLSVKALDEGLDVPDCDTAIIMSGTNSMRQLKQRIGRVLRKSPGKFAKIYQLYLKGTKEESTVKRGSNSIIM